MKTIIILLVVFMFCYIGYFIKIKYKKQKLYLETIKEFIDYYKTNMFVFRNNIVEIIKSFKIIQKNKNAIGENIFKNSEKIYIFDKEFAENYVFDKELINYINNYLSNIGTQNFELENEKLDLFLKYINETILKTNKEIKMKGDLYFKVFIAIGLFAAIIIW